MHQVETTARPAAWPRAGAAALVLIGMLPACNPDGEVTRPGRPPVPVASVSVDPASFQIPIGHSLRLSVRLGDAAGNVLPDRAARPSMLTPSSDGQPVAVVGDAKGRTGRVVTWHSERPAVASVDGNGVVAALRVGETTIAAASEGRTGTAHVVVTGSPAVPLMLVPARASLSAGESLLLEAVIGDPEAYEAEPALTWSAAPASRARVSAAGRVTALAAGPVTVTASDGRHSASAELAIRPAGVVHGLDFPGNGGVETTLRFEFTSPPAAYPATYIWRAYPRQQQSYYTTFFWGNNGPFYAGNTYYGFHPYPDWDTDYQHFWEIATPPGSDVVSATHVVYDRWYTQAAVCRTEGEETVLEFYWDWPDMTKVIRHRGPKVPDPPEPGLIVGDAPWNAASEVWDGILRGFQFYDVALTPEQIARELDAPGSVTTPWYLKLDPTPDDIADDSGNGNDPAWVGSERPGLWTARMTEDGIILGHH